IVAARATGTAGAAGSTRPTGATGSAHASAPAGAVAVVVVVTARRGAETERQARDRKHPKFRESPHRLLLRRGVLCPDLLVSSLRGGAAPRGKRWRVRLPLSGINVPRKKRSQRVN